MRAELFWNPLLLLERLGQGATRRRRLRALRGSVAHDLGTGHIDSLELLQLLQNDPPKVIYDVGANVGTWTQLARAIFPKAQIHAFEPLACHVSEFKKRVASFNDIHIHPVALGTSTCSLPMQVASFSDASSLLEIKTASAGEAQVHKSGEEMVDVVPLDDYVTSQNLPLPDLIKLDVQGYELEALRGGIKCLSHARAVIAEVSFVEFYTGQPLFEDVVRFMADQGFRVHSFAACTALGKALVQTDILFVRAKGVAS